MPDRFADMRHGPRAKPAGRVGRHAPRAAGLAGILLSGAMLAACSSSSDSSFSIFAEPGKYQYYTCAQIAEAAKRLAHVLPVFAQESILADAVLESFGVFVSVLQPSADHVHEGLLSVIRDKDGQHMALLPISYVASNFRLRVQRLFVVRVHRSDSCFRCERNALPTIGSAVKCRSIQHDAGFDCLEEIGRASCRERV